MGAGSTLTLHCPSGGIIRNITSVRLGPWACSAAFLRLVFTTQGLCIHVTSSINAAAQMQP